MCQTSVMFMINGTLKKSKQHRIKHSERTPISSYTGSIGNYNKINGYFIRGRNQYDHWHNKYIIK